MCSLPFLEYHDRPEGGFQANPPGTGADQLQGDKEVASIQVSDIGREVAKIPIDRKLAS